MNFFQIIKKSNQNEIDTIESSSIYDFAKEKLKPKSFAESNKIIYSVSNFFSLAYHFISLILAIIGTWIYSNTLNNIFYQIAFLLFCVLLLTVIELIKSSSSNTVFSQLIRKDKITKISLIILSLTTIFSFCTSVYSAKIATYSLATNSKFSNIDSLQNTKLDSVNSLFATQISSLESSIKASQNTLNTTKTNWKINVANKDLKEAQNALTNVLESKQNAINSITDQTQKSTKTTGEKGLEIAYFIAFIIALFELFNLASYYYYFYYLRGCVLESELIKNENVESEKNDLVTTSLNDLAQDKQIQTFVEPQKVFLNEEKKQKIGFQMNNENVQNDLVKQQNNSNSFTTDSCENCSKEYDRKTHNQRFCSTECRKEKWEKEKGKKLHFKARS